MRDKFSFLLHHSKTSSFVLLVRMFLSMYRIYIVNVFHAAGKKEDAMKQINLSINKTNTKPEDD